MTPSMRSFLTELAALMEKHNVDIDCLEFESGWSNAATGIRFTQQSVWVNFEQVQPHCEVDFTFLNVDASDIHVKLNKET